MKEIIFSFLVLFGLSQQIFSQCSVNIEVPFNENGTAMLFASCTNPQAYAWEGGGNMSFRQISASGLYKVTVTCTNGEMSEAQINVTVNGSTSGGDCSFNITETKNCDMNKLQVDCPDCVSYCWNTGAKTSSIDVATLGTYTVTVTGSGGCTSVASKEVTQIKTANVSVSGNSKVCSGEKSTLTANGGVTSVWSTGATTSSVQVPKGDYSVTVTAANGCTASVSTQITEYPVSPAPIITQSVIDGIITLTSTLPSGNLWSDGSTTQVLAPESDLKPYSLQVKDLNGCLSASSCEMLAGQVIHNLFFCPLQASFAHEVNGKKVSFKNTSSGEAMTQLWFFGDGTPSSNEANPMHEYSVDGTYEVKLITFKGTEISQFIGKVFVNTNTGGGGNATCPPMVSFMYTINDKEVSFKNTSSGDGLLSYLWDFGDGTSSTEKNPIHKYSKIKDYKVTLYVNTENGLISVSQIVSLVDRTVCDSTLIKATNGMKNGEAILPSQISSQTQLILEHPTATGWGWQGDFAGVLSGKKWTLANYQVGKHHFYVEYKVSGETLCSVFDYEILGGGIITDTDDTAENRARREGKGDINVFPNPTSGPIELDLSGLPGGQYMINVINQSGQHVTKKIIKQ